ncbi:LuxR C-terminal-related transcriptional regulator [Streptomyces sp. NBC_00083]|uniref:LuxR C-terminal-related transcriptional regulator n=1 Tax=Streptomyces sp. NBC_00083 TaxID=2975647 RepID=UPI00224FD7D0|nr:LuxR C-terminal-related transcriptional regulator [Streptomyces sp. NBC_00083]MCX5382025.1 LuxR C-terminal-related transcriptional regulator [Streptomyces sp. NBC_00083]
MLQALGVSTDAAAVYRAMLDHPSHGVEQIARLCGLTPTQVHEGLDELGQLMLIRASSEYPGQLRAVDPDIGLADIVARQEAELAERQVQLAASRAAVSRIVADRAQQRSTHGERLHGMDAIHSRLERLGRDARAEIMSVQPGIQRPDDLDAAREHDLAALGRGIAMRTLYQDHARGHGHIAAYSHALLSQGGEVRTAPAIPQRMVIVDRAHALVPTDPADNRVGALHVREPGIVTALIELFEQAWTTAVPLGAAHPDDPSTGLTDHERELLRLLGTGLTDEAVGQRLGLTDRTIRRQVASIMERLGASSRFEAGIKAAQKGWL